MTKRFLSYVDLTQMPQPQWMIEGLFERSSLVMLAGPSYSFKSFMLLDWLLSMASGRKWNQKPTQPAKVVYALGEGKSSLMKRMQAWLNHSKLTPDEEARFTDSFRTTFEVPQLASKASTDNFLADLEKEGFKPDVIAIDTFARSMVGMDENDAKDTGLWVEQADRLRQLGYTVIFLHHTKKNTELGVQYRGSTAIIGAMDSAMTLVRDGNMCTMSVTKQKDHDEGLPMRFRRVLVPLGGLEESCVLVPTFDVIDDRFAPLLEDDPDDELVRKIVGDSRFPSDRARGRALAQLINIGEEAAIKRVTRARDTGGTF
jgi:AAA domain